MKFERTLKKYADDFGIGYCSLSYLAELPIDYVKIDRSFIIKLDTINGNSLLRGVLLMLQKLGYGIAVESVENDEQYNWLSNLPYDNISIQGYLFDYSKSLKGL